MTDLAEQSVLDAREEMDAKKLLNIAGGHKIVWLLDTKGVVIGIDGPRHLPHEGNENTPAYLREVH